MVPPFEEFLSNSLAFFVDGKPHSKQELLEYCIRTLHLTDEDCKELTKQGNKTQVDDRVTWVITYYIRSGFLTSERKGRYAYYTITSEGKAFQDSHPLGFGRKELDEIPSFQEFQQGNVTEDSSVPTNRPQIVVREGEVVTKQQVLDIYAALDNLQKAGIPVTQEQLNRAFEMEVKYVKTEVKNALSKQLNPLLSGLRAAHDFLICIDNGNVDSADVVYSRHFKVPKWMEDKLKDETPTTKK